MKNLLSIVVLVFALTFTAQAQKKRGNMGSKLTIEQQTTLAVKKMTLVLDLSDKQQKQIKPIIMSKIKNKNDFTEKRKAAKVNKQKPTSDEIFAIKNKQLDNQIMMKNSIKNILNEKQFDKFEKMHKSRTRMAKNKMKERKRGNK
jgi:periplasmic protein CpxP/Spy